MFRWASYRVKLVILGVVLTRSLVNLSINICLYTKILTQWYAHIFMPSCFTEELYAFHAVYVGHTGLYKPALVYKQSVSYLSLE